MYSSKRWAVLLETADIPPSILEATPIYSLLETSPKFCRLGIPPVFAFLEKSP